MQSIHDKVITFLFTYAYARQAAIAKNELKAA